MKRTKIAVVIVMLVVAGLLPGCPQTSSGQLAGKWQYVAVDASSSTAGDFRAFLTFGETGDGGLGSFEYKEERLLPDDNAENFSWQPSYNAKGYYRTAPYGHPDESDIFTYWADTELNVEIYEYAPVLVQTFDNATGTYSYTLELASVDADVSMNSRAVFTITSFDELVIAWGSRSVAETGAVATEKEFTINEGIVADTYVRIENE